MAAVASMPSSPLCSPNCAATLHSTLITFLTKIMLKSEFYDTFPSQFSLRNHTMESVGANFWTSEDECQINTGIKSITTCDDFIMSTFYF